MLNQKQKIDYLKLYLSLKNDNYGDTVKEDIYFYYFDLENFNFNFLKKLETKKEIETKIEFIVSKFILNKHQDNLNNILNEYL